MSAALPTPCSSRLKTAATCVRRNYRTHWEKARAAIGKPNLRVHDLRHVGAVLAAQSGATTAELMHRLGHTTPQMALKYQHVAEGAMPR